MTCEMSDSFLKLIPSDPAYVPEQIRHEATLGILRSYFPQADEISIEVNDRIKFIDQGSNFERVICPLCNTELAIPLWQDMMDTAYKTQFSDLVVKMPCCGQACSLNDLRYEWPAGFAKFVLEVMNPNSDLTAAQIHHLELVLGCALRKLWQRI